MKTFDMTLAEAMENYRTDVAGIWEMVADAELDAIRQSDGTWRFSE